MLQLLREIARLGLVVLILQLEHLSRGEEEGEADERAEVDERLGKRGEQARGRHPAHLE